MNRWALIAIVIEAMAFLAWAAAAVTRELKFAFLFGFNAMLPVAILHLAAPGSLTPRAAIAAALVLYLLNMNVVILLWSRDTAMAKLDRHLDRIERHLLPVVMANAAGWLYALPFAFIARRSGPLGLPDGLALAVYALGTRIHFAADLQKRRFKARPGTQGRVLDQGLWRYSRHPNYFGDFLIYVAWALLAADPWAWLSPAANLAQYLFDAMPKSERWAADRYGSAWRAYAARTSRFIPWLRRRARRPDG